MDGTVSSETIFLKADGPYESRLNFGTKGVSICLFRLKLKAKLVKIEPDCAEVRNCKKFMK